MPSTRFPLPSFADKMHDALKFMSSSEDRQAALLSFHHMSIRPGQDSNPTCRFVWLVQDLTAGETAETAVMWVNGYGFRLAIRDQPEETKDETTGQITSTPSKLFKPSFRLDVSSTDLVTNTYGEMVVCCSVSAHRQSTTGGEYPRFVVNRAHRTISLSEAVVEFPTVRWSDVYEDDTTNPTEVVTKFDIEFLLSKGH